MKFSVPYGEYWGESASMDVIEAEDKNALALELMDMDAEEFAEDFPNEKSPWDLFEANNGDGQPYITVYDMDNEITLNG